MARLHVELCRRLAPDDVLVSTVAHPRAAGVDAGEPYTVHRQSFPFSRANRFVHAAQWTRWLAQETRAGDVLHCGNVRPVGYAVWWAARHNRVPYVAHVYGGDLLRERRKIAESGVKRASARAILGGAAGIIGCSKWTAGLARSVMAEAGVRNQPPVAGIDLGTDPQRFHPSHATSALRQRFSIGDAPLAITVARLVPHKGQDVALQAMALLAADMPTLHYVLIGSGEDERRLRALAAQLGLYERVHFAGALSDEETAAAYASATVYVGPSRLDAGVNVEGFGISFVEAGASGVPSVAGDSGGVRGAVRDGETGLVVPPGDPVAVAKALRTLLRDEDRRLAMGREARRWVEKYYNWDRVAAETRAFVLDATAAARHHA